jgi:serine/threonine-protein kinase
MRFFSTPHNTSGTVPLMPREKLDAGPAPGHAMKKTFLPGAQALLVTYATNAPEIVGAVIPLDKPVLTLGRRNDQDIRLPEATVSGAHAVLRWQAGTWVIDDLDSTNGTYGDFPFERKKQLSLIHGGEAQVGECRLKLVTFGSDSLHHAKARRYLSRRDGLTGLLVREQLMKALDEDGLFAEWAEVPMQVAVFELCRQSATSSERPTIIEMLALRRAVKQALEQIEALLLSLTPIVAGRTGPLKFAASIVGTSLEEARYVLDQVSTIVRETLPRTLELHIAVVKHEPGRPARTLTGS